MELWLDKTGQIPAQEAGEAAYWGTQLESLVRAEFTKRTGIEVMNIYAHALQESDRKATDALEALLEKRPQKPKITP